MACALTTGRKLPCKESVGGLSTVFFGDFGTLGNLTTTSGEVTAISGSPALFQYDLKGATSSLTTNVISSRDTGTTHYETTLEITLTHLDKATAEELKLIAKARPHIFVKDNNQTPNYFLVGKEQGAEVTAGTVVSGANFGELSGYTLTFQAIEAIPPLFVTASVVTSAASATQIDPA